MGRPFKVGDRIEYLCLERDGTEHWFPGVVTSVVDNGSIVSFRSDTLNGWVHSVTGSGTRRAESVRHAVLTRHG